MEPGEKGLGVSCGGPSRLEPTLDNRKGWSLRDSSLLVDLRSYLIDLPADSLVSLRYGEMPDVNARAIS